MSHPALDEGVDEYRYTEKGGRERRGGGKNVCTLRAKEKESERQREEKCAEISLVCFGLMAYQPL